MNGMRRNLARIYNDLALVEVTEFQVGPMKKLREMVGAFLCVYDDAVNGDFDMLIDEIELREVTLKDNNRL